EKQVKAHQKHQAVGHNEENMDRRVKFLTASQTLSCGLIDDGQVKQLHRPSQVLHVLRFILKMKILDFRFKYRWSKTQLLGLLQQAAMNENLTSIKTELQAIKSELSLSISNIKSDLGALKHTVGEMETSLSTCTDDIVSLQAKVDHLSAKLLKVVKKCEDLESRSRRNNIRIIGVPEDSPISATTTAISSMLKEALNLDKEPLLDRIHRTLQPKPKAAHQRIKTAGMTISIFPDYTAKTAWARAAFTDIRRQLRDIPGIWFGLLYAARLRVTYDGVEREFNSPEDARSFIKTLTK
uniref:L1 transposable element RRM domain-containing protein n=1 Tax=Sphaeramia orbicularis TaxID=375764 RepID=A0A673B3Z8_9TELE